MVSFGLWPVSSPYAHQRQCLSIPLLWCRVAARTNQSLFLLASLLFDVLSSLAHSLQYAFSILVHLQLVDNDLTRMNTDWDALAVRLFSRNSFDMDQVLQAVDGCDLPFATFVRPSHYCNFVVFSDGDAADLWKIEKVS